LNEESNITEYFLKIKKSDVTECYSIIFFFLVTINTMQRNFVDPKHSERNPRHAEHQGRGQVDQNQHQSKVSYRIHDSDRVFSPNLTHIKIKLKLNPKFKKKN